METDGEILAIDFYLTLSHRILYKENEFQAINRGRGQEGNIMLVKFLQKGTSHNKDDLEEQNKWEDQIVDQERQRIALLY